MSHRPVHDQITSATLGLLLGVAAVSLVGIGTLLALFAPGGELAGVADIAAGALIGVVLLLARRDPPSHRTAEWLIAGVIVTCVLLETLTVATTGAAGATTVFGLLLAASGGFLMRRGTLAFVGVSTVVAWGGLTATGAIPRAPAADAPILVAAAALAFLFQASRRRMITRLDAASRAQEETLSKVELQRSALLESEQRFREIAEGVREVFWLQDRASGALLYLSPRFRDVWGREPEEITSGAARFLDTVHPEDRPRVEAHLARSQEDDNVVEYRIARPDGTTRWIRDRTYRIGSSQEPRTLGVAEDITDGKSLESRYRTLFHGMPTPAWLYDFDTTQILEVNDAATRHYGYTREEFLTKRLVDLRPIEDVPAFLAARASVDPDRTRQVEARHLRADGSVIEVLVTAANFEVLGERVALAVCQDVTDKNRAHDAARRNERLASLGTLVAGVAHEINNPLTYMRGNAELIEMELGDAIAASPPGQARDLVEAARAKLAPVLRGMDQIGHITTSLRQVARKPAERKEVTDVGDLARGALLVAGPRFPQGLKLETDLRQVRAEVVSAEISQILLNLLFNAGDAVAAAPLPTIRVRVWEDNAIAHVAVEDNGHGIPEGSRERLFMPFHTTKPHGTGLGLTTSLAIAREHGGDLLYRPRPGGGSAFTLTLPIRARAATPVIRQT